MKTVKGCSCGVNLKSTHSPVPADKFIRARANV